MPIQTDNAWPAELLIIFEHRATHSGSIFESRYYGPYEKLLNYCFGSTFYVALENTPVGDIRDGLDSLVFPVVLNNDHKPVFIVEVKDDSWNQEAELRYRADIEMRERYGLMLDACPTSCLWGLSVIGTSVRVYCADKASYQITPRFIPRPEHWSRILPPLFLAGEWELDLLSQEGFEKMKEIVTDILTHTEKPAGTST